MSTESIEILIHPKLHKVSSDAQDIYVGILARTFIDKRGAVYFPKVCWKACRELVRIGLAKEYGHGRFKLCDELAKIHISDD